MGVGEGYEYLLANDAGVSRGSRVSDSDVIGLFTLLTSSIGVLLKDFGGGSGSDMEECLSLNWTFCFFGEKNWPPDCTEGLALLESRTSTLFIE